MGVAVKITLVPGQIVPEGVALILTLAAPAEFTVTLNAFEINPFPQELNGVTVIFPDTALPE